MMAPLGIKGNQRELHKLGSHALKQFLYKSGVIGAFIKARCTCQHGAWAAFFFIRRLLSFKEPPFKHIG